MIREFPTNVHLVELEMLKDCMKDSAASTGMKVY